MIDLGCLFAPIRGRMVFGRPPWAAPTAMLFSPLRGFPLRYRQLNNDLRAGLDVLEADIASEVLHDPLDDG